MSCPGESSRQAKEEGGESGDGRKKERGAGQGPMWSRRLNGKEVRRRLGRDDRVTKRNGGHCAHLVPNVEQYHGMHKALELLKFSIESTCDMKCAISVTSSDLTG